MTKRFVWPVRVYYEDTDVGGVVYYANYLKFMERARTEWLRAAGYEQDILMNEHNLLFAVTSAEIKYRKPAKFNDLLDVGLEVAELSRATIVFNQDIRRQGETDELLAEGVIRVACLNAASFRPKPIPADILEQIKI